MSEERTKRATEFSSRKKKKQAYFRKMRGGLDTPMPIPDPAFAILATLGAFLGIAVVGGLDAALNRREILDSPVLLASFGASAVLLFSVPESKVRFFLFFVILLSTRDACLLFWWRGAQRERKRERNRDRGSRERKKNSRAFSLTF